MVDDRDDDRGKKDNAKKEHKPEEQARYDHAPTGSIGQARSIGPSPGSSGSARRQSIEAVQQSDQDQEQRIVFRKSQAQDRAEDNRPPALDTDDPEVNADTDTKGERRMSMEEIKREAGTDQEPGAADASAAQEKLREENRGVYAPITGIAELDQQSLDNGYTLIEQDAYDRMKAEELMKQQTLQRDKDKGHGL